MSLLDGWRRQVRNRTACPWPGPRPMRAGRDQRSVLVGRSEDSKDFARLVYDTDVVVFTGISGAGKSSMLQLDLIPTLRDAGYTVLYCDDWNRSSEAADADDLIQRQVRDQISARLRLAMRGGSSLLEGLDTLYPDRSVILLDQFEELIRYQPEQYQRMLRWIEQAAAETRVRIVVSLRVEYEHELRSHHGLKLGPFKQSRYELRPISERGVIAQIIEGVNEDPNNPAISHDATELLLEAWERAGAEDGWAGRGLLHLQALLFALWMTKAGSAITASDLKSLRHQMMRSPASVADPGEQPPEAGLFAGALAFAVQVELDACSAACEPQLGSGWPGIDPVLASRTREIVHAMSEYLSSGGYKVSLAREQLAHSVIFQEGASALARYAGAAEGARLRLAELVDSHTAASVTQVSNVGDAGRESPDWLSISRAELLDEEPPEGMPWELDSSDVTSGVMLGLPPEHSLLEEFRSFYFALEWLRVCELVRLTTPYSGKTMVMLIHDLFGHGIAEWSRTVERGPDSAVNQFTALRGVEMSWQRSTLAQAVVANVRWRSCDVHTELRDVTFVNCDFRGTTFVGCTFSGVSFVNCMLDDAEFLACIIVGEAKPLQSADGKRAATKPNPSFFLPHAPQKLLESLRWHREPRRRAVEEPEGLYSPTAGLAAVPAAALAHPEATLFGPQPGGLSLFGGRVSSLKFRECDFGDNGRLALCSVAGTSVEFADQTHARIDVTSAAIRGLTFTRPIDSNVDEARAFDIRFSDSRVINVWFGVGLTGSATFEDCRVWQLFNAADRSEFAVTMRESPSYGSVNVEPQDPRWLMDLDAESLGTRRDEVWLASRTIDYRKRPVRFELSDHSTE